MRRWLVPALVLLVGASAFAADEAPRGMTADGQAFAGRLLKADEAWNLSFAADPTPRVVAVKDLASWGSFVDPTSGMQVLLADGGLLLADMLKIQDEHLVGRSVSCGDLRVPLEWAAGIVVRAPLSKSAADRLRARVIDSAAQTDRLLLDNGDELRGTLTELSEERAVLTVDDAPVDVKFERLSAVCFNPTLIDPPRPTGLRAIVGLQDGSRLVAVQLNADEKQARVKLIGGMELTTPTKDLRAILPLGGRTTYLSDLKAASYKHIPYLQLAWPYRADRAVSGSWLRADGKLYLKGLGMHSPARLTYDLDQPYARFEAEVAIDAEAGRRGSVAFRVFVDDGSGKWSERSTGDVVRGGEAPRPISVDLAGAKRISLLVDFAERGDELDHADWLNARLVR